MRKLRITLIVVLLAVAGVGWYLDWYRIGVSATEEGHKVIWVDVNAPKIGDDFETGKQQLRQRLPGQQSESPAHSADQP